MPKRNTITTLFIVLNFLVFAQDKLDPVIEGRITELMSTMTVQEKVGQTCQITLDALFVRDEEEKVLDPERIDPAKLKEAMSTYGIGSILNVSWHTFDLEMWEKVMSEVHAPFNNGETKAPIIYGIDAIHGVNYTVGGTLFPQEIGLAATWNPALAMRFGEVTAYETRASGICWNFSPVLDLGRQPLWSRNFETLGEDPFLVSEMGKAIICGYQGKDGIGSEHVIACMKHFVGYSNPLTGRDRTPAWIPDKYMKELYLPSFKAAVEEGALTVMINSGAVNGIPGHINYDLITKTLKEDWGFQGFAVSDWEDFIFLNNVHQTAEDNYQGIISAFNAGVDMSMVPYNPQYKEYCELMIKAVDNKVISEERLNDAVRRILRVKMIGGLFDKGMNQAKKYPDFGSEKFKSIALESALESITLLKNEKDILPLSSSSKVLIAGPTSDNLIFLNGAWTHTWQGANTDFNTEGAKTVREAFTEKLGSENCLFAKGAELYLDEGFEATKLVDQEDFKVKADKSDVIVLCLGEYPSTEKPGDIRSLNLDPAQLELAEAAYSTGKPVVLVMVEGRPRVIREIVEGAGAIVQAYLPGDYGADALVELIFGEENFSGKLPYTYPKYDGIFEFYDHPKSVARSKGNDFEAYDPQWDFGFGLSYSEVEYSNLRLSTKNMTTADSLVIEVDVTNKSERDTKEIVQLYVSDLFASMIPTGKSLKGFDKVEIKAGNTETTRFVITADDLKFVDASGNWISEAGTFEISIGNLLSKFELK
ncbi:MAG: glycoside hydrolase family 3 N-terminal domain-containing protein [Crocinitomicaceae bacterium]|nr:glycoside hydrolase family 3 N-terminal domain-containing protein [Crocinitomicaceae bacterium]